MTDQQQKDEQKKKSERDVRRFRRVYKATNESIAEDALYPVEFLNSLSNDIKEAHTQAELSTDDYRDLLTTAEEDAIKTTDALLESLQNEQTTILAKIAKLHMKHKSAKEKEIPKQQTNDTSCRIQKFETPKFSGEIRAYPAFKSHYKKHVEDKYGKDPFALISCLSGDAEKLVKPVEDDYDEMMTRLDNKYGRNEKQVDVILQDIKNLRRVPDGDSRGFYKMIEVIENCWLDLKRMGLQAEMDTTTMLSMIEKLLPDLQKREWTLQKSSGSQTFIALYEFLKKEKSVI